MEIYKTVNEILQVHQAPKVPGLTFRGFRGEEDYPRMAAVIENSKDADQVERATTVEEIANAYEHLTNCDPYQDMLFAEIDGEVIAYSRVFWRAEPSGTHIYNIIGFLLPEWRRKGIGRAMFKYAETRLYQIAQAHPPEAQRVYEAWASEGELGWHALLKDEGYEAVRFGYSMVRPLNEPVDITPMPDAIEIRPVKPEHYRAIWDADQEAFQDHWGFTPASEEDFQAFQKEKTFNPKLWKIAWAGEEVAGMVLNFVDEDENEAYERLRGYTEGISVRRTWRKRGLARALLTRSLQMFKDMRMEDAALGVDTQNTSGALRLYESVGFKPVKVHTTYRKPFSLIEAT
jgi:ribosomal protein S18 acetylase RimI-like enzyme